MSSVSQTLADSGSKHIIKNISRWWSTDMVWPIIMWNLCCIV